MRTVVFTSDNHNWLLKGFFRQWNKYKGTGKEELELEAAGFTRPVFLDPAIPFYSIGKFEDYPIERWSDGVIKYLKSIPDELVLIMLEDYWLIRELNRAAIDTAIQVMRTTPEIVRMDLAADRMFSKDAVYRGSVDQVDFCSAKGSYSLSFQASIWRRSDLIRLMRPGETPWETELNGSNRINIRLGYEVFGTYQWPMNYLIAVNKGKLDRSGGWMYPARTLDPRDWIELDQLGYTKQESENE